MNMVQGLKSSEPMHRELLKTYNATYWQSLLKLRLPAAMPFAFNGLKISTTLALIGAIVAEFFGSPIMGMGFRISTEVGRLALDVVWRKSRWRRWPALSSMDLWLLSGYRSIFGTLPLGAEVPHNQ